MQRSSIEPSKLSPSENIRCAVEHLRAVADNDYSQLFFQSRYSRWKEQSLVAHTAHIALQILSCHPQTARCLESVPENVPDEIDGRDLRKEFRHLDA